MNYRVNRAPIQIHEPKQWQDFNSAIYWDKRCCQANSATTLQAYIHLTWLIFHTIPVNQMTLIRAVCYFSMMMFLPRHKNIWRFNGAHLWPNSGRTSSRPPRSQCSSGRPSADLWAPAVWCRSGLCPEHEGTERSERWKTASDTEPAQGNWVSSSFLVFLKAEFVVKRIILRWVF